MADLDPPAHPALDTEATRATPPPGAANRSGPPALAGPGSTDSTDSTGSTDSTELTDPADLALEAELDAELAVEFADAEEHPARARRWWSLPLRIVLSLAMLWFLVHKIADVSFAALLPTWTPATIAWLLTALLLTLGAVVLATARWAQVLAAMGVPAPPFRRLVSHYFAGQFVSNVLPTTIGGDILRASRLAVDTGDGADSFASLIIERLTGWLILPLLALTGFALSAAARNAAYATTVALLITGGTVVALAVILVAADHPRLGGRFAEREGWRRFLGAVHLGVARIRRHPGAAGRVIAAGAVYQLVLVAAAWAGAQALGINALSFPELLAFFPAVLISQILPIGISGLGVREGALVFFLSPLGVPKDQAVALGLLVFVLNVIVSGLGAPSFLSGSRRRAPAGAR